MREDSFPRQVSDPAADGIPEYADDDSTANDDVGVRISDGPNPAPLPRDRDDDVNRFGDTAEEQRQGESLDRKLGRETPDPSVVAEAPARPDTVASPIAAESFDADPLDETVDRLDPGTALDDDGPVDPHLDSPVSMYDRPLGPDDDFGSVGRIVEPDAGFGEDTEKDMIGYDAGAAGGGASAEELAMHEVREP